MINKIKYIVGAVVLIAIATFGYWYFFMGTETLKDKGEYFTLSVPMKYTFIQNNINAENENPSDLAVYDKARNIYIYGNAYKLSDEDLKDYTTSDRDSYVESVGGENQTDVTKVTISKHEVYTYSFEYADSNDADYYRQVYWIKTTKGIYNIDIECPVKSKDKYVKDMEKIVKSFKETD